MRAMVAARDMRGNAGFAVEAIEHNALVELLKRYHRYDSP